MRKKETITMHTKIRIPTATVIFFAVWIVIVPDITTILTALAAAIHEIGHLAAAHALGVSIVSFTALPFGADIHFGRVQNYREELITASAGAIANLAAAALLLPFKNDHPWINFFICANTALAAINMLPIKTLDGGGVLKSTLLMITDSDKAMKICRTVSSVFLFSMWIISVYMLFSECSGFSLFALCCAVFLLCFSENDQ